MDNLQKLNELEKRIKSGSACEDHKKLMLAQCQIIRKELKEKE